MTDSAYLHDLRVTWWPEHDAYEIPVGDASWWVVDSGDQWDVLDPDGRRVAELSGHLHQDGAIHATIGDDPQPAGEHEVHLLTHAAAMGGWLSVDYVTGVPQTQWPGGDQVDSVHAEALGEAATVLDGAGMWEYVEDGRESRYVLTDRGVAKAAELAG